MSDCCIGVTADLMCPRCGASGSVVGEAPVRSHRLFAAAGSWRYCANLTCDAVFFLDSDVVDEFEVIAQVGCKAMSRPTPICFCFAHTSADIRLDVEAHDGTSTIKAAVKAAVAEGLCACEHLNPSGQCCLPDVHRAVKAAQATRSRNVTARELRSGNVPSDLTGVAWPDGRIECRARVTHVDGSLAAAGETVGVLLTDPAVTCDHCSEACG